MNVAYVFHSRSFMATGGGGLAEGGLPLPSLASGSSNLERLPATAAGQLVLCRCGGKNQ